MYIIWGIFILIVIFLILHALFKYNISLENLQVLWIFGIIVLFSLYVLGGLHITEGLESLVQITLTWIVYTILWITFLNVFMLGYFWSVIRNKTGPSGLRGPSGERGKIGIEGTCDISVSQEFCMEKINTYIDELYKAKTNTNILNTETQTFPCNYLNNKIKVMAGSRQYNVIVANLSSDNKPIINVINYLKSLWVVWFELIYDSTDTPGIWFTDEYADEEYDWVGKNPFDEIKKYDAYYWGITRDFRPLKAELCRKTLTNENAKMPRPNKPLTPRLKIIQTNDYYRIDDSYGANKDTDFRHYRNVPSTWWSPKPVTIGGEEYHPMGDIMSISNGGYVSDYKRGKTITGEIQYDTHNKKLGDAFDYNGPDIKTMLISGDVVDPITYKYVNDTYSTNDTYIYKAICPVGYKSLGDVFISNKVGLNKFKCVPEECVEDVAPGPQEGWIRNSDNHWNKIKNWFGYRSGDWLPYWHDYWYSNINNLNNWNSSIKDAKPEYGYNLTRAGGGEPFRKIKDSCLTVAPVPQTGTKEVEAEYADLGIGWNGHPYKQDPKYSIFTFLNLVPEGMIVNTASGRRFYVMFYGGYEANIYLVLDYNDDTGNYDKALQVDSNIDKPGVVSRDIVKMELRQQWFIDLQGDKKHLTLRNMFNNKYLYVGLDVKYGNINFTTIDLKTLQSNISKLGTTIDKTLNAKIIDSCKKLLDSNPKLNKDIIDILIQIKITNVDQQISGLCNSFIDSVNQSCKFTFVTSFGTEMDIIDKQTPIPTQTTTPKSTQN